eukprot:scaffold228_cov312-Pinguiococcus_pyrenoidosus.AAC.48
MGSWPTTRIASGSLGAAGPGSMDPPPPSATNVPFGQKPWRPATPSAARDTPQTPKRRPRTHVAVACHRLFGSAPETPHRHRLSQIS